jgi:hypothetical protein
LEVGQLRRPRAQLAPGCFRDDIQRSGDGGAPALRDDAPPDHGHGETARVKSDKNAGEIREQLVKLGVEHRELDGEIAALQALGSIDQLAITRLKRRKLKLKDQISTLEDQLLPDIIA